ncbi:sigma-54 dependent transcriptional regulator [Pseudooceanicola sp.]|uniref:sigma-54-dependent transcriptional regulator n=1 Tax=Pseudooceanicola sp. TaxID=1914328 RepID=UPI00262FE350|nr:sigma-54 dependent transcriptional regulator [Pseudooceanicola sp.]MDF1853845.1 sigma-54 dependent transcriptional regulator [Pseudooceanicola sp.]
MTTRVLLVDDDSAVREALGQTLDLADLDPVLAASFVAAKDYITADFTGVILSDIRMPGRDGFHLLGYTQGIDADLPVILLTGEGDIPMAVEAMRQGAFGFLEKPCASADLLPIVERALKTRALVLENRRLKAQLQTGDPAARLIFGSSDLSDRLRDQVRQVAGTGAEVLITGAPGTGIPKIAEIVHLMSPLARRPFVKRPAAGLTRDAFDAACDEAKGGTLFLDEIAAMPRDTQFAVTERLEQGAGTRVIAGASTDLSQAAESGAFSPDLYYRLDVMRVRIPALSERPEDIPVMFRQYVAQAADQAGLKPPVITEEVVAALIARDWPGNARALMSEAMRFVLGMEAPRSEGAAHDLGLAEQMARVERSLLTAALRRHGGHASAAAQALKLPRKTFYDKLARYGLRPEDFR